MDILKEIADSCDLDVLREYEVFGRIEHCLANYEEIIQYDYDAWIDFEDEFYYSDKYQFYDEYNDFRNYFEIEKKRLDTTFNESSFGDVCGFLGIGFIYSKLDDGSYEFKFTKSGWNEFFELSEKNQHLWDSPQLSELAQNVSVSAKDFIYGAASEISLRKAYHGELLDEIEPNDFAKWRLEKVAKHLGKTVEEARKDIDAAYEVICNAPDFIYSVNLDNGSKKYKTKNLRNIDVTTEIHEAAAMNGVSIIYEKVRINGHRYVHLAHGTPDHVYAFYHWARKSSEISKGEINLCRYRDIARARLRHREGTEVSDVIEFLRPYVDKVAKQLGLKRGALLKIDGPINLMGAEGFSLMKSQSAKCIVTSDSFVKTTTEAIKKFSYKDKDWVGLQFIYSVCISDDSGYMRKYDLTLIELEIHSQYLTVENEQHLLNVIIEQNKHLLHWTL